MRAARALLLLLFLGVMGRVSTAPSRADPVDAESRARPSMVIVSSNIGPHRDAIGAGVIVAVEPYRIRVVTARHVADKGPVTIWIDGHPWPAEIVRTFLNRDLAVVDAVGVRSELLGVRAAVLAEATKAGSALYIWGENETGLQIRRASVASPTFQLQGASDTAPLVSINCDSCTHGDSGGGMFDVTGRLVAILTARYHTVDNRTVAIVGERIDEAAYAITDGPFKIGFDATIR